MFKLFNWIMNGTSASPLYEGDMGANLGGGGTSSTPSAAVDSSSSGSPSFSNLSDARASIMNMFETPNPAPVEGQGTQNVIPESNPIQQETQQPQQPIQQPNEPILGKFKTVDDLAKSYSELEQFNSRRSNEMAQLRNELNNLQTQMQEVAKPKVTEPTPPTAEEITAKNEALQQKFYEDPEGFKNDLIKQAKEQAMIEFNTQYGSKLNELEAQKNKAEMTEKVMTFSQAHPDINQMGAELVQAFQMFPELNNRPDGLEKAYDIAQGIKAKSTVSSYKPPEQLLQDPEFVNSKVLTDPKIKEQFVQNYLKEIRSQQSNLPTQINSNSGGTIPLTSENKPKTMEEASSMIKKMLGG